MVETLLEQALELLRQVPPVWLWTVVAVVVIGSLVSTAVAVYVLSWPYRIKYRNLPDTHELTSFEELIPESRFVEVEGARLHYVQGGEGSDIVLLHGIGASVFIWRYLFPILQARHRVTAFDLAGFGQSCKEIDRDYGLDAQAELTANALRAIGIGKATLVGSSMGGAVSLWMAKNEPDRFEDVIALGPATDSRFISSQARHFGLAAPIFRRTMNRFAMKMMLGYVMARRELITDQVVERYLEPFRDQGESLRSFFAATTLLSDSRLPKKLADVRSRVLVIWGANDFMVRRWSIDILMRILPNARLLVHEFGGHHIMEDEPVWIAKQIELFLAER